MVVEERPRLHVLPGEAHTAALGEPRTVGDDQTIRWGSVRYSTPDGHQGKQVWCRVVGDELVIIGRGPQGLSEVCRHGLSTPGRPQISDAHYPHHPGGNGPKTPRPSPAPPGRSRSSRSGPGRTGGWSKPPRSVRSGSRRRWLRRSSSPRSSAPSRSTPRWRLAATAGRFDDGAIASITTTSRRAGRSWNSSGPVRSTPPNPAPSPGTRCSPVTGTASPTGVTAKAADGSAAARGAQHGPAPDAAALRPGRRTRGPGDRQGATVGPRRGPAGAADRGGPRP